MSWWVIKVLIVGRALCASPCVSHSSEYDAWETTKGHLGIPESSHTWRNVQHILTLKTTMLTLKTHPKQQYGASLPLASRCSEREFPIREFPFARAPPGSGCSLFSKFVDHSPLTYSVPLPIPHLYVCKIATAVSWRRGKTITTLRLFGEDVK